MSDDKLRCLAEWIEFERQHPGPRSAEVLFTLRRLAALWEQAPPARGHGSLSAGRTTDPRLLRVLQLMESRLSSPWTVATLARAAGMSRAAFARAFRARFGLAPLEYLSAQRFERARRLLIDSEECLAAIAASIGYQSEFAFSRAFKRRYGTPPGAYRRRARQLPPPSAAPRLRLAA
jgi:transcriptional regulator GlxA family with amidase domain